MNYMLRELRRDYPWHLLFWLGYLFIKIGVVEFFRDDQEATITVELISLPLKILAGYTLIYWLVPNFLLQKKYFQFVLFLGLSIAAVAFLRRLTDIYLVYPIIILYPDQVDFWSLAMFRNLIYIYPVVGLGSAIYFVANWLRNYHANQELQKQKLEAELKMLKSQINPHFLFNTINNIYSLALDRSEKTSEALLRLSDLLHCMLYDCAEDMIMVEKEVQLIHNYLNLEKLRYGKKVDIFFKTSGDTENFQISPLMLITLVENGFKHGVSESLKESWVNIDLTIEESSLSFVIENSKVELIDASASKSKGGIGLKNLRKRLDLEYPDRYELLIDDQPDRYSVKLKISND